MAYFPFKHLGAVIVAAGLVTSAMGSMACAESGKASLRVVMDRAKVVRISRPADTIIIGNPGIVDATVQDARTLILTGRTFGVTNLIILDAEGDPIVDETVLVHGDESNTVRVYRRAERETLACSPICEPTLAPGDASEHFGKVQGQITGRKNALSTEE